MPGKCSLVLAFMALLLSGGSRLSAQPVADSLSKAVATDDRGGTVDRPEWKQYFDGAGVHGCFILYDMNNDTLFVYNPARIDSGFTPASTFKIPNSLISLQTGVVPSVDDTIRWDGVKRARPQWNADQNMRSAMRLSTVWFYQELARRIGEQRMRRYIDTMGYGNTNITGGIDLFWLKGGMRITPRQQIAFLRKLYKNELPFSLSVMETVKDILIVERTARYVLRAKTGWGDLGKPDTGWYVGYLERAGNTYFFANNIDVWKDEDVAARIEITRRILKERKLIESTEGP